MAVLQVCTIGDPVLETKAKDVEAVDDGTRTLLADMVDTMRAEKGIGLAAPQVGISRRIVVMELKGKVYKLINPVLSDPQGESRGMEACLSVPDLEAEVTRADQIQVDYLDEHGEPQSFRASGLLARCIQHECDHLDGVLFVKRISPTRRFLLKKQIKQLRADTKARLKKTARAATGS